MFSRRHLPLLLLLMLGLYGCSGSSSDFEISLETDTLELAIGETRSINVTINRIGLDPEVPVYLSLDNPPASLDAQQVSITGTSGTFSLRAMQAGTYRLNLMASTDSLNKTLPLQVTVSAGFQISANASVKGNPEEKILIALSIQRLSIGQSDPVAVSLENPPAGISASSITITGDSGTLELSASTAGTYQLSLLAIAGQYKQKLPLTLQVDTLPGFNLSLEPSRLDLNAGSSGNVQVSLQREAGFTEAVTVQLANLPAGVSAPAITIPAGQSQGLATLSAASDVTPALISVSIQATSQNLTQTATFTLNIRKPTQDIKKETVATRLSVPWDLSFAPNGVLYFTEREGNIKKVVDGNTITLSHPLNVHHETEAGLMGLVFDPSYPEQPYLYVCYSYLDGALSIKNRVSRLTVQENSLLNESILINAIPGSTNHDGCRMTFGPDGKLYITTGDARMGGNAQDLSSLAGKILRINADGSVPSDNPLGSAIWSYGHRNAQGITFHPDGRLYSSEHGDASEDEVNRIIPGGNYGWPYIEGRCNTTTEQTHCSTKTLQEPLTVYMPTLGVSGLSSYNKDMFPEWKDNLLLASLKAGQLYRIILDPQGRAIDEELLIDYDYGRLRDVEVAPDGSIYIAVSNRDGRGINPFPKLEDDQIIRWYR